jgi:hypothetical protein
MKGADRRRELLVWLEERGSLTLTDIAARFAVSKMTVHRDLELLEKRRALKRIHGGALAEAGVRDGQPVTTTTSALRRDSCLICERPVGPHLLYTVTTGGEQQRFCCPHCGVSAQLAYPEQVRMAMATDFLSGRPHPAQQSWFVLGSVVVPCCRPSMLTFEDEAMARRFQTGFGGHLERLEGALDYLRGEMSLHRDEPGCPHCVARHSGNR